MLQVKNNPIAIANINNKTRKTWHPGGGKDEEGKYHAGPGKVIINQESRAYRKQAKTHRRDMPGSMVAKKGAVTHSHDDLPVQLYFHFDLGDRMRCFPPSHTKKDREQGSRHARRMILVE
jgi:hypothetical protein